MDTNYPSSGSKSSAGMPGSGSTGGTAGAGSTGMADNKGSTSAAGGSAGSGTYDDIGSTSSVSQRASHTGAQSGAWSSGSTGSSASMREELSSLKSDLDDLMSRAASLSDREFADARDKLMAKFGSMRHAARGMAEQARTQINQGVDVTSDYVKEKPLQSVAIAAGVGLLIGALMRGGRD